MNGSLKRISFTGVPPFRLNDPVWIPFDHLLGIGTSDTVDLDPFLNGHKTKNIVAENWIATNCQFVNHIFQVVVDHKKIVTCVKGQILNFLNRENFR